MDAVKIITATLLSAVIAYFEPVGSAIFVLMFIFVPNMLIGILCDVVVHKKRFNPKKFIIAFFYLAIYLSIVASIYVIGEHMGDEGEALFAVKWVTYSVIYFYITNILGNLRKLIPNNRAVAFLDFAVGLEFIKRIPSLQDFLKRETNQV